MRILILAPLALALSGCGLTSLLAPPAPATVANATKLDEQAALAVELAYQSANRAVYFAAKAGFLSPDQKLKAADADNLAYRAVLATRAAYDAGNATSYGAASVKAQAAVSAMLAITQ